MPAAAGKDAGSLHCGDHPWAWRHLLREAASLSALGPALGPAALAWYFAAGAPLGLADELPPQLLQLASHELPSQPATSFAQLPGLHLQQLAEYSPKSDADQLIQDLHAAATHSLAC